MDGDMRMCGRLERWRQKAGYIREAVITSSASWSLAAPWFFEGDERADPVVKWGIGRGRMRSLGQSTGVELKPRVCSVWVQAPALQDNTPNRSKPNTNAGKGRVDSELRQIRKSQASQSIQGGLAPRGSLFAGPDEWSWKGWGTGRQRGRECKPYWECQFNSVLRCGAVGSSFSTALAFSSNCFFLLARPQYNFQMMSWIWKAKGSRGSEKSH